MPVIDHPTHEKTIGGERYGCHNRKPLEKAYLGKDGYSFHGRLRVRIVIHNMSTECRYDQSLTDAKCAGCKHAGSGEAYAEGIRANGA